MNKIDRKVKQVTGAVLVSLLLTPVARAQIIPDGTLPSNSAVTPSGNSSIVSGGTTAGNNLFHSFREFSVPAGSEAFFNNAAEISNILTRVTGGKISNIDGLIRANGNANLFVINPNGIVFGPNARLDIGGSFFGATANSIELSDGSLYSAIAPNAPPLLTINVPIGLQFGGNGATVEVQGEGHRLATPQRNSDLLDRSSVVPNLEVRPERTLALLGNNVNLTGSTVSAPGGKLELGSPRTGTVALTSRGEGWDLDYTDISAWGDIRLRQQALADASGNDSSLQVRAGTLELRDGSLLLLENSGTTPAGDIRVEATDILATGTTANGRIFSGITTQTFGSGDGAEVEINADRLRLEEGATFQSTTFGTGNAGRWQANVRSSIEMVGFSPLGFRQRSTWATVTRASGSAGEIALTTQQLRLIDGSFIASTTFSSGTGSNISIVAEFVELTGYAPKAVISSSGIGVSSFGTGDAGSIEIDTVRLRLREGGSIAATGFAEGNGGNIEISAAESISISGVSPRNSPSQIQAEVGMAVPFLQQAFGLPDIPSGEAGNIAIETPSLRITDGAQINVANEGIGAAGTLQIGANAIRLNNMGGLTAQTASGVGGNIILDTQTLQLRDDSFISAAAGGTGNGGNLTIDTNTLAALGNSDITANAFQGMGGNIAISTRALVLSPDSAITASSQFGVDGIVEITNPDIDSTQGLVNLPKKPFDEGDRIVRGCGTGLGSQFVVTGRGGLPPNPEQQLTGDRPWTDLRDLSAFRSELAKNGSSSDPQENDRHIIVEANAWIVHPDGTVELVFDRQVHQAQMQAAMVSCNGSPLNTRREN